jgi:parallel beta-helix repeat protein
MIAIRFNPIIVLLFLLFCLPAKAESIGAAKFADMKTDLDHLATQAHLPGIGVELLQPLLTGWMADFGVSPAVKTRQLFKPQQNFREATLSTMPIALALLHLNTASDNGVNVLSKLGQARDPNLANVLVMSGGQLSLNRLAALAATQFPGSIQVSGDKIIASWPLFIWADAKLVVEPGDRLVLSGKNSSFIVNQGIFSILSAEVSAEAGSPVGLPEFRPFIVSVVGGSLQAHASQFIGLGFAGAKGMEGVVVSGTPMIADAQTTVINGNTFRDIGGLVLSRLTGASVNGNRFVGAHLASLHLKNVADVEIVGNILVDGGGDSAIAVDEISRRVSIEKNLILNGKGEGITIAYGASEIRVFDNLTFANQQDGITVDLSSCVHISRNTVVANGGNGIRLGRSSNVILVGNSILRNSKAGTLLHAIQKDVVTTFENNVFAENAAGIRGQGSSQIQLMRNDFSKQFPVLVSGDLSAALKQFVKSATLEKPFLIASGSWASAPSTDGRVARLALPVTCKSGN